MIAFGAAVEQWRTDMLELDVHFSRDGVAWVSHDPSVDRCTDGHGAIAELGSAELERLDAGYRFTVDGGRTFPHRGKGVRIPRLSEVLHRFGGLLLNIDLKVDRDGAAPALADEVRRAHAEARVCCGSEFDARAGELAQVLPDTCLFYPRDALTALVLSLRAGEAPPEEGRYHVLDMPLEYEGVQLIDDALIRGTRERDKWINVWTIDDEAEMRRLVGQGVGGIMTDRPDRLRQVLSS
jgi:glycerophosphoryl diester phosphodiesterase